MWRIRRLAVIGLVLAAAPVAATTLPDIPYDRLVALSDEVFVGEVLRSRESKAGEITCAVIYDVAVEHSIAGDLGKDSVVSLGPFGGLTQGAKYLFFVDRYSSADRLIASTNSTFEEWEVERARRCRDASTPYYAVLMEGVAALEVSAESRGGDSARVVHFPPMWVLPPKRVEVREDPAEGSVWGKDKLVDLDDLLE